MEFTLNTLITIINVLPLVFAFGISLNQYLKGKYLHNLYMLIVWGTYTIWSIGQTIAELLVNIPSVAIPTKIISDYFIIIGGFGIILLIDSVSREYVDPIKFSIMHILAALVIVASFILDGPNASVRIGYREGSTNLSVISGGYFKIFGSVLILLEGFLMFFTWLILFRQSPKGLRKYAGLNLTGGILVGLITPVLYLLGLSTSLPGSTNLTFAVGALLSAIAFAKEPKLAYVLPFKAVRIATIETQSGLSLFSHDWIKSRQLIDNVLFSGMIQGLCGIMRESLKRGEVKEVHMDNAILLMQRSKKFPLISVLVADKSNRSLRRALNEYSQDFDNRFGEDFKKFQGNVAVFDKAIELVHDNFPYIPNYD